MSMFLTEAPQRVRPGAALAGLPPAAIAWTLARGLPGPAWIIVAGSEEADRVHRMLSFFLSCDQGARVLHYPDDDQAPYAGISPPADRVAQRLQALDLLRRRKSVLVVAPVQALLARVPEAAVFDAAALDLRPGLRVVRRDLADGLSRLGYLSVPMVEDPGTFSLRGGIVDLWPVAAEWPVRLDFLDEEIESIRSFDPADQRGRGTLKRLRVLPAREWILHDELGTRFMEQTRAMVEGAEAASLRRRVLDTLRSGLSFAGVEDWLPALHPVVSPLVHAPHLPMAVLDPVAVKDAAIKFFEAAERRYGDLSPDERPLVGPRERYEDPDIFMARIGAATRFPSLVMDDALDFGVRDNALLRVGKADLGPLVMQLRHWEEEGWRLALVATSASDAERLQGLLQGHGLNLTGVTHRDLDRLKPGVPALMVGDLGHGFQAPMDRIALVTTDDIFVDRARRPTSASARAAFRKAQAIASGSLKPGHLVVHRHHGIGRFEAMARLEIHGVPTDLLKLSYRGGDILYLPVARLDMLARYEAASEGAAPLLDRLGGQTWATRKTRVKDAMLRTAHELLRIFARREVADAPPIRPPGKLFRRFEANFPYGETPDQEKAIREVLDDLAGSRPMDRLVVGDVGFGKTEVAMRAAARMVEAGKQVAVLCPTTVLAYQHHETWKERFEGFPVKIGMLSRFTSDVDGRRIVKDLAAGQIDVVIGTTRLLGRAVRYQDLGLVIADEEHRFGVKQKEAFKKMRAEVHFLALSATPIPRSLHMALSGVRAFSTIATPPSDRLAVRTRITRFNGDVIREEILREMGRGGQVFFVHNRVRSIDGVARYLARKVPEARIVVTHGQMPDDALEEALVKFVRKQADILLTTSIIESGVDLPNVNCLIVNRADRFGLAQLYQLRGRVGRSFRRARCILLVPGNLGAADVAKRKGDATESDSRMSRLAVKRLRVLQEHQELGAGFSVASADLEHRGPGTILGESQHGHVDAVGFDTYTELLEEAMAEARGEMRRKRLDPEVEVPVAAYLPESFIAGVEERLEEYRRLSLCESPEEVRRHIDALEQRMGTLPQEVLNLGGSFEIRLRCRELGIVRCTWMKIQVGLDFSDDTIIAPAKLAALVARLPNRFSLAAPNRLMVRFLPAEAEYPFRFLHWALRTVEEG